MTLVERVQKKAAFLMTVRRSLGLSNVTVLAKDLGDIRGPFDIAVARAAFPVQEWAERGGKLIEGGVLVAMITSTGSPCEPAAEFIQSFGVDYSLGGKSRQLIGWRRNVPRGTLLPLSDVPRGTSRDWTDVPHGTLHER